MDLHTRQRSLEAEMVDRGVERFRRIWEADMNRADVSRQTAIGELLGAQIEPLAKAIDEVRERALSGRAGRKSVVIAALSSLESEVLAYMTAKEVLNGLTVRASYGTTQRILGKAINDQILVQKLANHDQSAIDWVEKECKRRKINTRHHKERYFRKMAQHRGSKHRDWTNAERIQVGAALCELFCEVTQLARIGHVRSGKKTKAVIQANPALHQWISARNNQLELLNPDCLPMVVPPVMRGADCTSGGYLEYPTHLVKGTESDLEHLMMLQMADTSDVRKALHALDKTGYRINRAVFAVMQTMANEGGYAIPGLEKGYQLDLPVKPADIETNEEARRDYAKQARAVHDHNAIATSVRLTFERTLVLAERFKDEPVLYFPNQLDFRGRAYPLPATLNPQGPDFTRALLEFNEGKAVDSMGLFWLRVNLANLYGEDKVSLHDRVVWAMSHNTEICAVADNPLEFKWWMQADKPWQFLAACIDYALVLKGHKSHIRVAMDGSCNGIQHFAALLLDPVAASAVNLAVSDLPRDIYQDVADVVISDLKMERDPQKKLWADQFLALGIDRKITKRSVMVMPYGGTFSSTMKYVDQECTARGYPEHFGDQWVEAAVYLSKLVYEGTRTVVKSGAEVMGWLQSVAKVSTGAKHHLHWTTPTGFVAKQKYVKHEAKPVKTYLDGKCLRQTYDYEPTVRIDALRSRNGISPNYVHSMDAAAMMIAVLLSSRKGVTHLHCIHDDFGTHAADTQCLFECLRSAFVGMYSVDQLRKTWKEFSGQLPTDFVPEPPTRGTFDIHEVTESKYFFS